MKRRILVALLSASLLLVAIPSTSLGASSGGSGETVFGSRYPALALSTFVVNTTKDSHDARPGDGICADSAGKCSLRAAAEEANESADADRVTVPAGTYTYTIERTIAFLGAVAVSGAGAASTIIDGTITHNGGPTVGALGFFPAPAPPVSGHDEASLGGVTVRGGIYNGESLTIAGVTSTGSADWGFVDNGGVSAISDSVIIGNEAGILNHGDTMSITNSVIAANTGLGIVNLGEMTIVGSTIRDNVVALPPAAPATDGYGGGIHNRGTLSLTNSTVSGNVVTAASVSTAGGGIYNRGTLSLTNSTVSGNDSDEGAGIYNFRDDRLPGFYPGVLTLHHSTVANNRVSGTAAGGGVYNNGGSLTATASILDGNMGPAVRSDCFSSAAPTSGGYNFVGDATGCMWVAAVGDVVGSAASPLSAGLGPLRANGGPTQTHALLAGGPPLAINTVPSASCAVAGDQRGVVRPQGALCDKGAFEVRAPRGIDDTYSTPVDTALSVPAPGVLGNDKVGDGGALSVWVAKSMSFPMPTSHGVVTYRLDGSFDYMPNTGFEGVDSFQYAVRDGTGNLSHPNTDSAMATITVGDPEPTVGLVDPGTGVWRLRAADGAVSQFYYGVPGDYPFVGDWDCDGTDTPGLYRQSDGYAYLRNSNTQGIADRTFFFGNPGDIPLAGDFDGDECDTLSIYRPSEARFYVINELGKNGGGLGAAEYSFLFGDAGDKPVVGDWDGDGIDEIGLHRESSGFFYYRDTLTTGIADGQFYFGNPGDRFVAGDWGVVDGSDTPGLFRPSNRVFYFRHTLTQGNADAQFTWNGAGISWLPVAGDFDLN